MSRGITLSILGIALAACGELSSSPIHAPGAPSLASSATGTGVVSSIADADPAIAPALQIRSDGGGLYNNSSSMMSIIQSVGDWTLDSYNARNSSRTLYLDFSQPIPGSGPNGSEPTAIPSGFYKFHLISKCSLYNNSYWTVVPGTTVACPLHIGNIMVGTRQYAVHMNPLASTGGTTWTGTDWVNVTCMAGTGSCTRWSITPSGTGPDGSRSNVAALLAITTSTGKGPQTTTTVRQGDFRMAFRFEVSR